MPIYEYDCPLCGRFETIQKASDKPLKAMPGCQNAKCPRNAKRLVSASSFHLKGSGWYKTDYASAGKAATKSSDSNGSGPGGAKESSAQAESKSADASGSAGKPAGGCGSGCACHSGAKGKV